LYGVTSGSEETESGNQADLKIPGFWQRTYDTCINGIRYINIVAPADGTLDAVEPPQKFLMFNLKQRYQFNHEWYTVWSPPDDLFARAGYPMGTFMSGPRFKAGEPIARLKLLTGDHLFVDRITYNFRHPKRGEIIVFETRNITTDSVWWSRPAEERPQHWDLPQDQFYIKRLVALGGEKVQIGDDRHLTIDGKRLDSSTPHFEKVYGFDPATPPARSKYSGHVKNSFLAPLFTSRPDGVVTVRPDHYMVMGDNTLNSYDSRDWGDFSRTNVIGKYFFVYWPFGERFGWTAR